MNKKEFDNLIDTMTENSGTMSAICASDLNFVRTVYELTSVEKIRAKNLETLQGGLRALSASPYAAFVIALYIPQNALKMIAQDVGLGEKFALIGAVGASVFEAVIGCYKKR